MKMNQNLILFFLDTTRGYEKSDFYRVYLAPRFNGDVADMT